MASPGSDGSTAHTSEETAKGPKLLASSGDRYNCSIGEAKNREWNTSTVHHHDPLISPLEHNSNYFTSAQWSADGTSLITTSADHSIRTFIVPPDLLERGSEPHDLKAYSIIPSSEPISAIAPYPFFNLGESSTTLVLSSPRDLPIRLSNVHHPSHVPSLASSYKTGASAESNNDNPAQCGQIESTIAASYSLITTTTEKYLTPASLLWSPSGTSFYTGTDSLICIFDVHTRTPSVRLPTIPSKRHKLKGGGVGIRGIVSALSIQPSSNPLNPEAGFGSGSGTGMLAAGTWTRCVGLYDAEGLGGTVATWDIRAAADKEARIGGMGVSQVSWSGCGRYLLVAERRSKGVLVYDVRVTHRLVGWLEGREADTNQRMSIDVFQPGLGDEDCEVWAGGTDGKVRVWRGVGQREGSHCPDEQWEAHGDPVSSTAVHRSGMVLASCSGQRRLKIDIGTVKEDESDSSDDGNQTDNESESGGNSSDCSVEESSSSDESTTSSGSLDICPASFAGDNTLKIWCLM